MRLSGKFHAATAMTPQKRKKSSESTGGSEPVWIRRQEEIPALPGGDCRFPVIQIRVRHCPEGATELSYESTYFDQNP